MLLHNVLSSPTVHQVLVHGEETEDTREYDVAEKKEMEKKKHK